MKSSKKLPLWAAIVSYFLGAFWVCCLFGFPWDSSGKTNAVLLLFACLFFPWAGWILRGKSHCREHWFWMVCTFAIGAAIALKRLHAADVWGYLAMHGFAAYWVVCYAGILSKGETSAFAPLDGLEALVLAPFGGFFLRILTVGNAIRNLFYRVFLNESVPSKRNLLISVGVLICAVPLFLLTGNLLSQADASFRELMDVFLQVFSFHWEAPLWLQNTAVYFLFGLPVGAYLFGLVGSSFRRETGRFSANQIQHGAEKLRVVPMRMICSVLSAFVLLYLLFFGVQAGHLFAAFYGTVPGKLTAAQFAREGFFQLCKVVCINFLLLVCSARFGQTTVRTHRGVKSLSAIVMVESIFLAVTAASKLVLYIQRFGFTPLRLLSFWGILVLCAGCLLALASLRKPCKAVQKFLWFSAATFTLLCFF